MTCTIFIEYTEIAKKYVSLLLIRSNPFYEPKSSSALNNQVTALQETERKMKRKAPQPPVLSPKTEMETSENMSVIHAGKELSSSPKVCCFHFSSVCQCLLSSKLLSVHILLCSYRHTFYYISYPLLILFHSTWSFLVFKSFNRSWSRTVF